MKTLELKERAKEYYSFRLAEAVEETLENFNLTETEKTLLSRELYYYFDLGFMTGYDAAEN
jgi:hypothetical protein